MARSVDVIQQGIITQVQATPELAAANSTSKRAIWRLWTFVVAVAINILEQLMDVFKSDMEVLAAQAVPGTASWIQAQVFKFQYSATNPQVVQLINLIPVYPVMDSTLYLVTRCSVKTDISGAVNVKVAKGATPQALAAGEVSALQSYINTIGYAGIVYNVISANPDQLYIKAAIYYKGQYNSVIAANVKAAITNYLAALPFDGSVKVSDLEGAIKAVAGVNDVVFDRVSCRADATAWGGGTDLVLNQQTALRLWNTVAGYMIPEATSGNTLDQTLNFIAE